MTYQYTLTTGDGIALETLNDRLADLTLNTTQDTREFTERNTELTDEPTEYSATVFVADNEPLEDADAELKGVVQDAESATIRRRHTYREYDDETIADPDYYDVNADKALRTNPTVEHSDDYNVEVTAQIHIDGTEYDHETTVEIPEPTHYARKDRLVATADGIERIEGTSGPKPVNELPHPDTPTGAVSLGSVVVKEHIDRIPNGGIETASMVGERGEWQTVVARENPEATLESDTTTLTNDGEDEATLTISLSDGPDVTSGERDVVLSVDGDPIGLTVAPGGSTTETLTTTKTSGSVIDCQVTGTGVYDSDVVSIEVSQ